MKTFTNYAEKKAKQFLNLLQGYTKGIRMTAILILLLMGVSNAWGATQRYIYVGISKNYYDYKDGSNYGFNFWGGTSAGVKSGTYLTTYKWDGRTYYMYRVQVYDDNNKAQFKGNNNWWDPGDGYSVTLNGTTNNAVFFSHQNDGWQGQFQQNYQETSTAKLTASNTSVTTGTNVTLTPSLSSNDTYNQIKSTTYTVSTNPNSGGSVTSAGVFSATKAGTYTVTATVTYNPKYFTGITKTATATITITVTVPTHTVSYGVCSTTRWGSIKLNSETAITTTSTKTLNYGTSISFTATPNVGYQVEGWYSNSGCTSKITAAGTSTNYDAGTLTADKTVYVKFEAIPVNSHNITYTAQGTGWTYGNSNPTTAEEGATVTFEVIPTTGYTVTVTSSDVSLSKNGNTYTFTMPTNDVTINVSATENTHDVTISYKSGGVILQADAIINVSEANAESIEAPAVSGYAFTGWTLGDGITNKSANTTTNPISITTKTSGAYTLTANYEKERCVYFVNTARWTTIKAYAWNDSENNGWPGANMTKESEQIGGYDVYKYVMPAGKNYDKLVFNQGNDDGKTGDLDWEDGKYYVYSAGQWVDKNEVADLLPKPVIYFKNNPKWTKVYVYFLTGDNYGDLGASSHGLTEANKRCCAMTQIGTTDVWKYDYGASGVVPGNVIAFTEAKQPNYNNFHNTKAAYRTDFNSGMELFIPQEASNETKNGTKYYNKGLWMKYNSTESGYELAGTMLDNDWEVYEPFTASAPGNYHFDIALSLSGNHNYEFKVKNIKNDWYGKLNTTIDTTQNDLVLEQGSGDTYNIKLTTTSAGNYIFSIDLSEGTMKVSVEYPLMVGDYRMVYIESATKGTKTYTKFHPAQSIRGIAEGDKLDTVSFFINKTKGINPAILLQKCTAIDGANATWTDVAIQYINGNGGANPVLAQAPARKAAILTYEDGCTAVTSNGVYNFVMQQTDGSATFVTDATHPYTGNYYIRTDGAEGGWRKYLTTPDNIMTHSQTALTHGGYDYYFCEWMIKGNNVKYVVANDYSYCVSDTLAKDDIVTDVNGNLPADANVRYTWNSSTNALKRAYINGSSTISDRYLVLIGNEHLKDASGNPFPEGTLHANETAFADMGNWLYQVDVKASEETLVKLTANYNGTIQYFKGDEDPDSVVNIITGATNYYKFRLIYDFKTNYLLCGLIEDEEITEEITVDEAMISRSHHDQAQTFQVAYGKSITTIKTVYGVMTFNKTTLNDGSKSQYERALYWVSFPFDVDLGEAFGFGNYGEHWIMEYYDGEARAKNGLWVDSDTYWRYITNPKGHKLKAGEGYVLCLDLDLLHNDASVFHHSNEIALYFPSLQPDLFIANAPTTNTTNVTAHKCEINRPTPDGDRRIKDSNWNIIGIPCYTDIDNSTIGKLGLGNLQFLYQYNADNTYTPQTATKFNTMHAYMVQYAGDINWINLYVDPAQMAARRNAAGKDQYTLRLALQQEGTDHDHTFIRLQEDNVTAEFDINYDLCKIINRGANIYSMIGNVEVAANVLPVEERVIPLGLDIEEDGNYTFAMPDGTDGITAILIDYETGKETNLLLADYTVELNAGIDNERFALRVRPSYVATEVENTILTDGNDNVKKYIIDGALYLLRDGKLYDAQGRMIQQ